MVEQSDTTGISGKTPRPRRGRGTDCCDPAGVNRTVCSATVGVVRKAELTTGYPLKTLRVESQARITVGKRDVFIPAETRGSRNQASGGVTGSEGGLTLDGSSGGGD